MNTSHRGFTLIEIMVVIVIVAILMAAVTLSFPPVGDKLLKENAERFSALVSLAQDESILQSAEMSLEIDADGYGFYRNENNQWTALSEAPFKKRRLPERIRSKLILDGVEIDLEDREKNTPQIVFLSSGEITPFTYQLFYENKSAYSMKVGATGEIEQSFSRNE
ncbi:MAG: type II secretion system protein GspH [Thiotrichales bacterium]|nr:MAG: type II secretion system protein GspH [Thiotrichales bacterium]